MDFEQLCKAIHRTANRYACNGNHESDLIADAFEALVDEIQSLVNESKQVQR